jgi:methionyl-tRNA formyltransferase
MEPAHDPEQVAGLRIVVMGTGPFAVPMFRAILASPHRVVALVTRPDKAAPGRRAPVNPMRAAAEAAGVTVTEPERINDPAAIAELLALAPDLFVVCDYGQILAPAVLEVAPLGGINLHGSLLPRHRGAAPVQWAILAGDEVSGACCIHMTPQLDGGSVIVARSTPIGATETAAQLEARLAAFGPELVLDAIQRVAAPHRPAGAVGTPQDPALVTKAPRLSKADGIVDWNLAAARIARMPRGLDPWPRATTFLHAAGGESGAGPTRLVLEEVAMGPAAPPGSQPGSIVTLDDAGIVVACGDGGTVVIRRVVPEGRRSMAVGEFLRGRFLGTGARMGQA